MICKKMNKYSTPRLKAKQENIFLEIKIRLWKLELLWMVFDNDRLFKIDHTFRNVGGLIADAFQMAGN